MKDEAVAGVAQALAHPVRLRIVELLRDEGAYVMHLTTMLGRPQANVSQHLAILRDAGLVIDERDGMTVKYRVRDERVFEVIDLLTAMAPSSPGALERESPPFRRRGGGFGRGGQCRCPRCSGRVRG